MRRLTGLESFFVSEETPTNLFHVGAVAVLDPVRMPAAASVSESAQRAKAQDRLVGGALFGSVAEFLVPLIAGAVNRTLSFVGPRLGWPPFNVVVSSFPGSPTPLYCAGSRLVAYYPLGPVVDGAPLNITVTTYRDELEFGLLACEDTVPDLESMASRLQGSIRELVKLTAAS
jgi:diacylglycerol O-acyltransferase / wax synthase